MSVVESTPTKPTKPIKKAAVANKKTPVPRRETKPITEESKVKVKPEEIVDPLKILAAGGVPELKSVEEEEEELNPQMNPEDKVIKNMALQGAFLDKPPTPTVRKIAIKKISRFLFRLNMEKQPEKFNIVPGCSHTWMCGKRGEEFVTGLENLPQERARLEKAIGQDLGPKSSFYSNLTVELEDKEHGHIMNFDDRQMGPYYEVIYYAMLASPIIANGLQEYRSGKKPEAEWYIENKEAEAEAREQEMYNEQQAFDIFGSISLEKRHGIAKLLGLPVYGVSPKVASGELWQYVKKDVKNATKFLEYAKLRADQFAVTVLVKDAVKTNVMRKNKLGELVFANNALGFTEEQVVAKLILATNADLRIAVERQVESKR